MILAQFGEPQNTHRLALDEAARDRGRGPDVLNAYGCGERRDTDDMCDRRCRPSIATEPVRFPGQLGPLVLTESTGPDTDAPMGSIRTSRSIGER